MSNDEIVRAVWSKLWSVLDRHPLAKDQLEHATLQIHPLTMEFCKECGVVFGEIPDPRPTFLPGTVYGVKVPHTNGPDRTFLVECQSTRNVLPGRILLHRHPILGDLPEEIIELLGQRQATSREPDPGTPPNLA